MERRNWSLKALQELQYIDSLDEKLRADSLIRWSEKYLNQTPIEEFDLELNDLRELSELFYKNINFLHKFKNHIQAQINDQKSIKEFLK